MSFLRSRPPISRQNQPPYQRRALNPAVGGGSGTGAAGGGVSVKRKIETHKPAPPIPGTYTDYKLVSTTREAMHHVMRFHGNRDVNPMTFSAPVKLQRKRSEAPHYYRGWNHRYNHYNNQNNNAGDIKNAAGVAGAGAAAAGGAGSANGVGGASGPGGAAGANGAAAGGAGAAGAPGQAPTTAGGADISLIAPYGRGVINKQMLFKKRTKQVFLANEEERRKKEIESAPWVIEDYDSQNVFTGQLEGGQHAQYMLFVFSDDGFKVVPADKWYKFSPKIQYPTLTSEEAEEQYQKYTKQANMRWLMRKKMATKTGEDGEEGAEEDAEGDQFMAVDHEDRGYDDDEDERARRRKRGKHGDADEMDFEEVFQDDEEAPIDIPGFEEEDRDDPRKRPRGLGYGSDEDDDEEDDGTKPKLDAQGREIRKSLLKLEKNRVYAASDDEKDPYASDKDTSDSDLDEVEKEKEKEVKKEEEQLPNATSILEKANKKKQAAAAAAAKGSPMLGKKNAAGKPIKPVSAKMMKGKGALATSTSSSGVGSPSPAAASAAASPAGRATSPSTTADGRALSPPAGSPSKMRSASPVGRSSSPPTGPSEKKKRKLNESGAESGADDARKQRVGSSSNLHAASVSSGAGSGSAAAPGASAGVPASAEGPQDDSMLITEDEVVHILRTRTRITTRDLINELKKKLKKDVRNRNTLAQIIKKVALVQEGFLVLRN
ncbi:hypothetical protein BGW41_004103 [Actinomortierella wolfii]|nr:hypothetical protein BGW41_004103 [Actinomortierella wolfii]